MAIQSTILYALGFLGILQILPVVIRVYLKRPGPKRFKLLLLIIGAFPLRFRVWAQKTIRTDEGVLLTGSLRSNTLLQCVYMIGCYEPNLVAYLKGRLGPGDIFLDIGANSGHFSLLAAKLGAKVISVEAAPANCRRFSDNVAANSFDADVRLVRAAAGSRSGEIEVRESLLNEMLSCTSSRSNRSLGFLVRKTQVPVVRIDDILEDVDLKRIRFVKIDVEGAELDVLRGLTKLIEAGAEELEFCVEFSPNSLTPDEAKELFTIFQSRGYCARKLRNYEVGFPPYRISDPEPCPEIPKRWVDLIFSRDNTSESLNVGGD